MPLSEGASLNLLGLGSGLVAEPLTEDVPPVPLLLLLPGLFPPPEQALSAAAPATRAELYKKLRRVIWEDLIVFLSDVPRRRCPVLPCEPVPPPA